jgi:ankyrin repeat protein
MEDLFKRVPLLRKSISEELDDLSMVNFKDASQEITKSLKNESFYWIRVLRAYNCFQDFQSFKDSWARVVKKTPHVAARKGHLDICKLITKNVQDKNPGNNDGRTPFHDAAKEGHLDICKLIIENIKDKNPEGVNGDSPLHLAAEGGCWGHLNICKLIIANVQDKNPRSNDNTSSHWTYWLQILSELCFQRVALSGNYEIVAISTDKNNFF